MSTASEHLLNMSEVKRKSTTFEDTQSLSGLKVPKLEPGGHPQALRGGDVELGDGSQSPLQREESLGQKGDSRDPNLFSLTVRVSSPPKHGAELPHLSGPPLRIEETWDWKKSSADSDLTCSTGSLVPRLAPPLQDAVANLVGVVKREYERQERHAREAEDELPPLKKEIVKLKEDLAATQESLVLVQGELAVEKESSVRAQGQLAVEKKNSVRLQDELAIEKGQSVRLQSALTANENNFLCVQGELATEKKSFARVQGELATEQKNFTRVQGELAIEKERSVRLQGDLAGERELVKASGKITGRLRAQIKDLESRMICRICFARPRNALCLPCLHSVFCIPCLELFLRADKTCPACRAPSKGVLEYYS